MTFNLDGRSAPTVTSSCTQRRRPTRITTHSLPVVPKYIPSILDCPDCPQVSTPGRPPSRSRSCPSKMSNKKYTYSLFPRSAAIDVNNAIKVSSVP